jgi:hypothetical protein
MARSTRPRAQDAADVADAPVSESPADELARLIREQRQDQRQGRRLRSTLLGECLRGVGVVLVDDLPRSRPRRMDSV